MQEEINISTSEEKGWLGKIKDSIYENWQTILVALVVLIVGISAYNYNTKTGAESSPASIEEEENSGAAESEAAEEEEYVEEQDQENAAAADKETTGDNKAEANTENTKPETKIEEKINTVEASGEGYKISAARGDGITHLARKAVATYLSENADSEVTSLHKIYAEDYLQNRIGNQKVEVGYEATFSKALIREALDASKKLSQKSLSNLKKYEVNLQ